MSQSGPEYRYFIPAVESIHKKKNLNTDLMLDLQACTDSEVTQ